MQSILSKSVCFFVTNHFIKNNIEHEQAIQLEIFDALLGLSNIEANSDRISANVHIETRTLQLRLSSAESVAK